MERCFVIQPFDGAEFDQRFDSVLAPAIQAAGLEPYRVDRDPKVSIPIQDIEAQIRSARICLADISLDNPNVWFEVGFAIAADKDVVLICSEVRQTKFPFDVQHRNIIRYKTGAPQEFAVLEKKITERIEALLAREVNVAAAAQGLAKLQKIEGLDQHEVVALATMGENLYHLEDVVSLYQVKRDMERSGYTQLAATLAMKSLIKHGLVSELRDVDRDGEAYVAYSFTNDGWDWVLSNKKEFVLKKPKPLAYDVEKEVPF